MPSGIAISGANELIYALQGMEPQLARRVLATAMRKAAAPVLRAAKSRAPVSVDGSHGNPPGTLRDSLKIRARKRRKGQVGVIVQTRGGDYKGKAFYGAFIEYGTCKMAAMPYLRPAFDTQKMIAQAIAIREIRQGIENVAAGLWKPRKR